MKSKNDGKKKRYRRRSANGPVQIDGKKGHVDQLQNSKSTVKYTFERTKKDIENLEKVRRHLKSNYFHGSYSKSFNTDSEIYRELPNIYLNAVKEKQDLQLAIDELTAKLDQLEDLRSCFCRIFELCGLEK
jgi:ribosome-associated translation inhibitor RaiA